MAGTGADFAEVALADGKVMLHDRVANTRRIIAVDEALEVSNARVVARAQRVSGTAPRSRSGGSDVPPRQPRPVSR
jgi:hypothetical protein